MQIADDEEWSNYLSQLDGAGEEGQMLRRFFTAWAEEAEKCMESAGSRAAALRQSLQRVPDFHPEFVGPSLLLLGTHWKPIADDRDGFFAMLTPIEQAYFMKTAMEWVYYKANQQNEELAKVAEEIRT